MTTETCDFVVVKDHPRMLEYVDMLQKANVDCLSFYPWVVFERERAKGRLYLALLNGDPCGYIYVGASKPETKCHQVCIQYDARLRLYGAALVSHVEAAASKAGVFAIKLRCGFDLGANDFWKSLGYLCVGHQKGGARRMRTINIWRKQLIPELFEDIHIEPAQGKQNSTLWRKHKQSGIVTKFSRGAGIASYRAVIEGIATAEDSKTL